MSENDKVHALFYLFGNHGYCDPLLQGEIKLIPSAGDMYLLDDGLVGTYFVEIDQVVYLSDKTIHIYCSQIQPDFLANPPYYGTKNNKGSLAAHSLDQINDFPQRYGSDNPKGFLSDMINNEIEDQKQQKKQEDKMTEQRTPYQAGPPAPSWVTTAHYRLTLDGEVTEIDGTLTLEAPDALEAARQHINTIRAMQPKRATVTRLQMTVEPER